MPKARSIVDRSHELFNARDWDGYREVLDEDVVLVMSGVSVRGRPAVVDFLSVSAATRAGLRVGPERVVVETEDTLVTEVRMIDTTAGGEAGALEFSTCSVYRAAGGRIVEWRVYLDEPAVREASASFAAVAAEQSALRRVAELVARQASPEQVFGLVTEELNSLLDVTNVGTARFEPDGTATVMAVRGTAQYAFPPGTTVELTGGSMIEKVFRTGLPAHVQNYDNVGGPLGPVMRELGAGWAAAGPIVVDGRLWGAMVVNSSPTQTYPPLTEQRVAKFAELVSTAISNIESRANVERLVAEQSALRRVAELVARQAPPQHLFALVTEELSRLLGVNRVRTVRRESDGSATILAARGPAGDRIPSGTNVPVPTGSVVDQVFRTVRPARVEYGEHDVLTIGGMDGARCGAGGPIVVDGRLWGAMVVGSETAKTLPSGSEDRVARFAELVSTAISNIESRASVERLVAEQSALRRVAMLVARHAPAEEVFALVTEELSRLLGTDLMVRTVRFEPDGTATIMAARGMPKDLIPPGTNTPRPGGGVLDQVFRTGRPGRVDDYKQVTGPLSIALRDQGICSAAAGPIVVDDRTWGAMAVASPRTLPAGSEDRVAQFAELVSTAISNIESRAAVERLAAEQSALRRVATLVAREHSPEDLFATLAEELGVLLEVDASAILRYEADASATVVAGWGDGSITLPLGERFPLAGDNLAGEVHRSGAPQRKEDYNDAPGPIAATVRALGFRSAVASPIVVEGATWGVIAVLSCQPEPLPPDTEARLAEFTRHAGMAVANAKSRSDLAESRARIVRTADEVRRRFERDLHDGAQQRLVSLGLQLRAAEATLPADVGDLQRVLARVGTGLKEVLDDLRELSRGLHPAVLSEGGLTPALGSLARRSSVPVDLRIDVDDARLEEPVEAAAYYVVSEALTNTAKHAQASRAVVSARERDGWLELRVSDDGTGGADASGGSGLTGLVDRVEAIGGTIQIDSRPDFGTAIRVKLPAKKARR